MLLSGSLFSFVSTKSREKLNHEISPFLILNVSLLNQDPLEPERFATWASTTSWARHARVPVTLPGLRAVCRPTRQHRRLQNAIPENGMCAVVPSFLTLPAFPLLSQPEYFFLSFRLK